MRRHPDSPALQASEVAALAALRDEAALQRRLQELERTGSAAGPMLLAAAAELRAHGQRVQAMRAAESAVGWFETRAAATGAAADRAGLARALLAAQRWGDARPIVASLHAEEPAGIAWIGRLGTIAARMGDTAEALRREGELRQIERPYTFGQQTFWRARIAALLGEQERAVALLRQALDEGFNNLFTTIHDDADLATLAGFPAFDALRTPKR